MKLTLKELYAEREHIVTTRLGILCGAGQPTEAQLKIANDESDKWLVDYEASLKPQRELVI